MTWIAWGGFVILVLFILGFDLGVFTGQQSKAISARQALFRTFVYFVLSCLFTVFVYFAYDQHWLGLGIFPELKAPVPATDTAPSPKPRAVSEKSEPPASSGDEVSPAEKTPAPDSSVVDTASRENPETASTESGSAEPAKNSDSDAFTRSDETSRTAAGEAKPADDDDDFDPIHIEFPFETHKEDAEELNLPDSGRAAASMFFTGYLVEQSLSMDNIFVIALILAFFQVPAAYQHRLLFWGILGALVMRGVMIAAGAAIIHQFHWIVYFFGALLVYTAIKMMFSDDDEVDLEHNRLVRFVRRVFPVYPGFVSDRFFTVMDGRRAATPMFIALVMVESTDLLFAVDSIPAVFGITQDPFLVFTSNVFAILGLRSLYFALADLLDKFRFLKFSLVAILMFVGVKMIVHKYVEVSPVVSLLGIILMLGAGIGASFAFPAREEPDKHAPESED